MGCWSGDLKSEGKGGDSNQVFKRFRKAKKEERKREMNRLATRERERGTEKRKLLPSHLLLLVKVKTKKTKKKEGNVALRGALKVEKEVEERERTTR